MKIKYKKGCMKFTRYLRYFVNGTLFMKLNNKFLRSIESPNKKKSTSKQFHKVVTCTILLQNATNKKKRINKQLRSNISNSGNVYSQFAIDFQSSFLLILNATSFWSSKVVNFVGAWTNIFTAGATAKFPNFQILDRQVKSINAREYQYVI